MSIRLTKNELRNQERKWRQLEKYLPTLQLKKALLQLEVNNTLIELQDLDEKRGKKKEEVEKFKKLMAYEGEYDLIDFAKVMHVDKTYENIAGVDIPLFQEVHFAKEEFSLFDSPVWFDAALASLKELMTLKENMYVVMEKKRALEEELREVSIRVNLFEKVLIPRCLENIKKIRIFLGDQMLFAVAQAKVAKRKIQKRASL